MATGDLSTDLTEIGRRLRLLLAPRLLFRYVLDLEFFVVVDVC